MKSSADHELTLMTGPDSSNPPNSTTSPTTWPGEGIIRTAVVLLFTTPIDTSSAMMADMVAGEVSPGTVIMSRPTEHTQVMASSFSSVNAPQRTASIIPASSLTG